MREISAGAALGAGFRLIGREPAAFAAWCGVYFLIGVLPQALVLGPTIGMMQALGAGGSPTSQAVMDAQAQVSRVQPLSFIASLLMLAILPSAAFRAMLFPEDRRFLYLRLGMRELWMGLSALVVGVISVLVTLAAMMPTLIGGALAARSGAGAILVAFLLLFPLMGVAIWAVLRLSLAPVMSFADRTFRFPEAWRLSRGHAGRMFLVALGLFVLAVMLEVLILGVGFGLLAAATPDLGHALQTNPASVFTRLGVPGMVVSGLLLSVVGGGFYTLGAAAWASIYSDLAHNPHEVFS